MHAGHLPSPENVHINETVNIKWNPPYYSVNNDVIHVDPHITHYTVYITDIYTRNTIKENVTETQFTFNTREDDLCPMYMYQVSAWNAGGEGEKSQPVQESTLRGKEYLNSQALCLFTRTLFSLLQSLTVLQLRMSVLQSQKGLMLFC